MYVDLFGRRSKVKIFQTGVKETDSVPHSMCFLWAGEEESLLEHTLFKIRDFQGEVMEAQSTGNGVDPSLRNQKYIPIGKHLLIYQCGLPNDTPRCYSVPNDGSPIRNLPDRMTNYRIAGITGIVIMDAGNTNGFLGCALISEPLAHLSCRVPKLGYR